MASWDIVLFTKDNSCEYLPSSWAVDETKTTYLWPKKLSLSHIIRLKDSCAKPSTNVQYAEYAGNCRATVYSLTEAQKLAEKARYTSNLSSDNEESHSVNELLESENSSDSNDNNNYSKRHTSKQITTHSSCSNNTPRRFSKDVAEARVTITNSPPLKLNAGSSEVLNQLKKMTKSIVGIKHDQSEIKQAISEINIKLNAMNVTRSGLPNFSKFDLPLKNQADLDELEAKIEILSGDEFKELVNILAHVGGVTAKKNTQIIMKKLMTKELSLQYSAHGKKQKKSFSKLTLYKAVLEAVKLNFKDSTDLEITQYLGIALATAGDWDGGRGTRTPVRH